MDSNDDTRNTPANKIIDETTDNTRKKEIADDAILNPLIEFLANCNGMDDRNKKANDVLKNEGTAAAVKHMFTDDNSGKTLSYAEMRQRYG